MSLPTAYQIFFDQIASEDLSKPIYGCNEFSLLFILQKRPNRKVIFDPIYPHSEFNQLDVSKNCSDKSFVSFLKQPSYERARKEGFQLSNYAPDRYFENKYKSSSTQISRSRFLKIAENYKCISSDFFGTLAAETVPFSSRLHELQGVDPKIAQEFSFIMNTPLRNTHKKLEFASKPSLKVSLSQAINPIVSNVDLLNKLKVPINITSDCEEDITCLDVGLSNDVTYLLSYKEGLTKASGKLFQKLPKSTLHIGDNFLVDGILANEASIDSVIVNEEGLFFRSC